MNLIRSSFLILVLLLSGCGGGTTNLPSDYTTKTTGRRLGVYGDKTVYENVIIEYVVSDGVTVTRNRIKANKIEVIDNEKEFILYGAEDKFGPMGEYRYKRSQILHYNVTGIPEEN